LQRSFRLQVKRAGTDKSICNESEEIMDIPSEDAPMSDAQELIWALLDDQISDPDFVRLEAMLASDEEVRRLYVQCTQIHVDLQQWFGSEETARPGHGIALDLPLTSDDSMADPAF
jgi:hypothetical protein